MSKVTQTSRRKADHIRVNPEEDVQSGLTTGLERLHFKHNPVPELDLAKVDTSLSLFGRKLDAPILISSMTGGTQKAQQINLKLAAAAQARRVAMGVGSQRAAIENPELIPSFQVRQAAPDILLFANLGAVQLNYGYGLEQCQRAVEMIEADALVLHFNPLQEALQPEGDSNFAGLLEKITQVCRRLEVPVIAKEVGWGFSAQAAQQLVSAGVQAIDVAGAGGTSWSQVEMHRATDQQQAALAAAFIDWGIPTAQSLQQVHQALPAIPLIASGGLRSGIDIAKCIALGARLGGMAGPFLKAAQHSTQDVIQTIDQISSEVRICMFASGCGDLSSLQKVALEDKP
jgi:isopentenyl-diphosphate delta-isomerase